ncbi:META domain-containing protein [Shewanella subflava]|uniref:META domain-containing protein n=1 Tax=Shewanella subflava TaxID=2986476 RepID=A0ABT3IAW7_9GAMM|nr:META domain-containing protein [Shewanella subflava]MCW3173194.1 META domain-containing protein [Shewanella subflava]
MIKHFLGAAAVIFSLSACQSHSVIDNSTSLIGTWHIESVLSAPTIDYSPAKLIFTENGQLSGNTSCNPFMGHYTFEDNILTLSPAGSTRKACIEALMTQEQKVMKAMPLIKSASINQGKLRLVDQNNQTIMVLSKLTK